jgi:hypothetical protein
MANPGREGRWQARSGRAVLIRVVAFLTPIAASLLFVHFASRLVAVPTSSFWLFLAWWVGISAAATVVLVLVGRLTRRLLPLAALYRLSLVFPDQAPSRFRAALKAGNVASLEHRVREAKAAGSDATPVEAAERLLALVAALDTHDRLTRGHADRVRAYAQMIGQELHLRPEELDLLNWAALLHDVGKLEVPAEILQKPGRPTEEEWSILLRHPEFGAELIAPLRGWLGEWAEAVLQHHERWDGEGYPDRRAGEQIALAGRIVAVADVFDVITSARSYKDASDTAAGREEIARCAGSQFDPRVVRAFLCVSFGRLRLAMGPLSWLSHAPILARLPLSPALGTMASAVGAVAVAVGAGAVAESKAILAEGALPERPATVTAPGPSPPAQTAPGGEPLRVRIPGEPAADAPHPPAATSPPPAPGVGPNAPPVTAADEATTNEDTPVTVPVLANDTDPDGDDLELLSLEPPELGWVEPAGPAVIYHPPPDASGETTFRYTAGDGNGAAGSGAVTVTVLPVNDPPVAVDDEATVPGGGSVAIDVLANDGDVEGDGLALVRVGPPTVGSASHQEGRVVYTAPPGGGAASFDYTVADGAGATAQASVVVAITAVNEPPSFVIGPDLTVAESSGRQRFGGWATEISPGPAHEAGQTVRFGTSAGRPELFAPDGLPSISADGTLTFAVAPGTVGTSTVTVVAVDDGGTANGGNDSSLPQTFSISIQPVNEPPSFRAGGDQVVGQDAGRQTVSGWATAINPGSPDEAGQNVRFAVVAEDPSLFAPGAAPAVAPDGTLTYEPAAGVTGKTAMTVRAVDDGGTAHGGSDTSAPQTFTITIVLVNSAPSFAAGGDQFVLENAGSQTVPGWATAIRSGPPDEASQTVAFMVTTTNSALFAAGGLPSVDSGGTLTYTPAEGANGSATVTVRLVDDGGTAFGGADTSPPWTFTIVVLAVNSAPSFEVGPHQKVLENAGVQTVAGWATAISAGPPDEAGQSVTFVVTCDNPALFAGTPTVAANGTLTFTPAPDVSGSATLTVVAKDDGGTANGGQNSSVPQTFTIEVGEVNSPPSFQAGPSKTVLEDPGAQTVAGWATAISPGPNEVKQTVTFTVTNDNNALFADQPAVDGSGTLSFTPAANASGAATVTVRAVDDGGTADGGSDTSPPQTFTITVTAVNDPPVATDDTFSVSEDDAAGVTFDVLANDSDVEGDPLSLGSLDASSIANGALTGNGGGSFTYVPKANFNGSETFSYVVADGNGGSDSGSVTITVVAQPDAPSTAVDAYSTLQDAVLVEPAPGVLANDADEDGDPLTVQTTPVTGPSSGTLTLSADGSFTYTPNGGFAGTDTFTYRVEDGTGSTADGVVTITVAATITSATLYMYPTGSSADVWDLLTAPAPAAAPVPDHDGDGDPGLFIKSSDGDEDNDDPREYHDWSYAVAAPLVLDGPVKLQLWSTIRDFKTGKKGHPHIYLYDCDGAGGSCVKLAQTDIHVDNWNSVANSWAGHELTIGSVTRTITAGRTLRVRLLFGHEDLWVALTAGYPSALVVTLG